VEKGGLICEVKVHCNGCARRRLIRLTGRFDLARFSGSELQALHMPLLTIKMMRWEERDKRLVIREGETVGCDRRALGGGEPP
jgi:hypothetical protein